MRSKTWRRPTKALGTPTWRPHFRAKPLHSGGFVNTRSVLLFLMGVREKPLLHLRVAHAICKVTNGTSARPRKYAGLLYVVVISLFSARHPHRPRKNSLNYFELLVRLTCTVIFCCFYNCGTNQKRRGSTCPHISHVRSRTR